VEYKLEKKKRKYFRRNKISAGNMWFPSNCSDLCLDSYSILWSEKSHLYCREQGYYLSRLIAIHWVSVPTAGNPLQGSGVEKSWVGTEQWSEQTVKDLLGHLTGNGACSILSIH